jgi:hypothetical protein
MGFPEWVRSQPYGVLKRLERELGIGYTTINRVMRGVPCSGRVAKLLSDATGGLVTVEALVCPQVSGESSAGGGR